MSYRKDFIEKETEKFSQMLAILLGLKVSNKLELFELECDEQLTKVFNENIVELYSLSATDFLDKIVEEKNFTDESIYFTASILKEKGEVCLAAGLYEQAINHWQKALMLFSHLNINSINYRLDLKFKITEIKNFLNQL